MTPRPLWRYKLSGRALARCRAPLVDGDTLYAVLSWGQEQSHSVLISLDKLSGRVQWECPLPYIAKTPVLRPGGGVLVSNFDGNVCAVDAGGSVVWTAPGSTHGLGIPWVADDHHVIVADHDKHDPPLQTWCLDPADGRTVWTFENGGSAGVIGGGGGRVVHTVAHSIEHSFEHGVFDDRECYHVYCLSADDGNVLWSSGPTDERLYDAFVHAGLACIRGKQWHVYDIETGTAYGDLERGSLFLHGDRLRLSSRDGVRVVERSGHPPVFDLSWVFQAELPNGDPTVVRELLFYALDEGVLLGLDAASGNERFRSNITPKSAASLTSDEARFYVGHGAVLDCYAIP